MPLDVATLCMPRAAARRELASRLVITIRAYNSRMSHRAFDYVCDGTADEVQFTLALLEIEAAGGGVIELSDGDFFHDIEARIAPVGFRTWPHYCWVAGQKGMTNVNI